MAAQEGTAKRSSFTDAIDAVAQDYYDSDDAFNFYKQVWGGAFIHVGLYDAEEVTDDMDPTDRIKLASELSAKHLFVAAAPIDASSKVMDMGSAYGGNARLCAQTYGCTVTCIDISRKENAVNREVTAASGLADKVLIPGEKSFFETGEPDASYDVVVSQDSLLHAGSERHRSIGEAARVLKPGGILVFTDIMQSNDANTAELSAVYKRIHLTDMGSPATYKEWGERYGLTLESFEDRTVNLPSHYGAVKSVLQAKRGDLTNISSEYVDNMINGLAAWVTAASKNNLCWGYMRFRKNA
jgi:cyclopropane fatty-acyl-phospholipid synthase-like methyltransferase